METVRSPPETESETRSSASRSPSPVPLTPLPVVSTMRTGASTRMLSKLVTI